MRFHPSLWSSSRWCCRKNINRSFARTIQIRLMRRECFCARMTDRAGGDANAGRHQDLVSIVLFGAVVRARKRALHPRRTHGVALQHPVHLLGPIVAGLHEDLAFGRHGWIFEQRRKCVPLLLVDPWQTKRSSTRPAPPSFGILPKPASSFGRPSGRRRIYGGFDLFRHDEVTVQVVQKVPCHHRPEHVLREATVGHGLRFGVEEAECESEHG
mmetsp:Transcript_20057/g.56857  ORF Transcript_20057/g.56857 Transcript_20057/m.56857 type:complete len:213 (-) Transcript_20057:111-749(-)